MGTGSLGCPWCAGGRGANPFPLLALAMQTRRVCRFRQPPFARGSAATAVLQEGSASYNGGMHDDYLFSQYDLRAVMDSAGKAIQAEVEQIDTDRLLILGKTLRGKVSR
jgi:hypothetical protein